MKKIVLLLLLFTGIANAQNVTFNDANFYGTLIVNGVDTNNDTVIQVSEALAVTALDISASIGNIADLTGIEEFINLTSLDCENNGLTTLDVSMLSQLTYLNCGRNQLTSLNVSGLTNLQTLLCNNNFLTSVNVSGLVNMVYLDIEINNGISTLDLTGMTSLQRLNISSSNITSLDISHTDMRLFSCNWSDMTSLDLTALTNLETLNCGFNTFTSLDLSGNPNLKVLYCVGNHFPSLDLSNNTLLEQVVVDNNELTSLNLNGLNNLQTLSMGNNHMTSFDFSGLPALKWLEYSNDAYLTTIDISNNPNLIWLYCYANPQLTTAFVKNGAALQIDVYENPALQYVCADEGRVQWLQDQFDTFSMPNVVVNSYCNFTPGGDHNTISGTMTFDAGNNGCDENDPTQAFIKVKMNDGTTESATFTNAQGNYTYYTMDGNFTLTPDVENPSFFTFTPASATVNFPAVANATATQDFCIAPNGVHPDLEVVIAPYGLPVPGFDMSYKIVYRNKGNQMLSGLVTFEFDDSVMQLTLSTPASDIQSPGVLGYNFTSLMPFEGREIYVNFHLNSSTDTPPLTLGDELVCTAHVIPSATVDETPQDNIFVLTQTVVSSLDPNDKICLEGEYLNTDQIGNYLHYVINFENTGTANAVNVVVKDVIDTTRFDINSLQVLNSSHPVSIRVSGNTVEFVFASINLPPSATNAIGGHGNVLFKIKTLPTLNAGDMVTNTANIYFDYNHPIETNEARTTFNTLKTIDFEIDSSVSIAPNPVKNFVNIKAAGNIKSLQLFDGLGRILQATVENKNRTSLDISDKPKGIYFLRITTENGSKVQKLVKE